MPKSGAFKTGEGPTGDIAQLVLAAAVHTLALSTPTHAVSGSGSAPLGAAAQSLAFEGIGQGGSVTSKSGQAKTGEFPTGGAGDTGLQLNAKFVLRPDAQTLTLDLPTATVDPGTVNFAASVHDLALDLIAPNVGYDVWVLDGSPIGANTDELATHRRLTIGQRVTTNTLTTTLRPLKSDEGQVDVLATDSGGYIAVDRANGGNSFTLTPPVFRQPLRQTGTYHVDRYEEDLVSQDVSEWQVEVEFVPDANRTDSAVVNETAGANDWALSTPNGTIATDRVDAEFLGTGADGVERFELTMRLTFEQAHAWETEFDRIEGVRVRAIPDATNVAVDDTSGNANTVNVTAPTAGDEVPSGDYVVVGWESVRLNEAFQEISAEIADAG